MGKKSDKLKEEAALTAAKTTKKAAKAAPAKKKAVTKAKADTVAPKATAPVAAPKAPVAAAPAPKATVPKAAASAPKAPTKPAFTNDDIALRAYFIAEKRHKAGIPGDAHHDWLEAECQLLAESKKKASAKAAAKA